MEEADRRLHVIAKVRRDESLVAEIGKRYDLGRRSSVIYFDISSPTLPAGLAERLGGWTCPRGTRFSPHP